MIYYLNVWCFRVGKKIIFSIFCYKLHINHEIIFYLFTPILNEILLNTIIILPTVLTIPNNCHKT